MRGKLVRTRVLCVLAAALVAACGTPVATTEGVWAPPAAAPPHADATEANVFPVQVSQPAVAERVAARAPVRFAAGPGSFNAVIVGINDASGSRPLQGAVNDARHLGDALKGLGAPARGVRLLLGREATKSAILSAAAGLQRVPSGGLAVFSFAGHARYAGGTVRLVAADGALISASELAKVLAPVRAALWIAMPTCYAGAFDVPGITGRGRVATFASSAHERAMEWGGESYMFRSMVSRGLIERRAPAPTVESAFWYAHDELASDDPNLVPLIDDQYPGELALAADGVWPGSASATQPPEDPGTPDAAAAAEAPEPSGEREEQEDGDSAVACGSIIEIGSCPQRDP